MEKILTAYEMSSMDQHTIRSIGIPSAVLMERAALASAEEVICMASEAGMMPENTRILAVCGAGNNGGDGFACARILKQKGWNTACLLAGSREKMTEECAGQLRICEKLGIPVLQDEDMTGYQILIDAVFGIGLTRNIEGRYRDLINEMNASGAKILSVDIPSGINADTGTVMGCAVRADRTVAMQYKKPGLLLYPGGVYAGKVRTAEIGVTEYDYTDYTDKMIRVITEQDVSSLLAPRLPDGHKGTFGKVLIIAGSENMPGAALLASSAALRAGAGMVKLITVPENRDLSVRFCPELMIRTYRTADEALSILEEELPWCDAAAAGPGMGISERTEAIVQRLLSVFRKPLILDADALGILAGRKELLAASQADITLTPHLGEMSRLTGQTMREIKADLIGAASALVKETGVTCHLKDGRSVTVSPEGTVYITVSGNAGMAAAGSGDVLTGMLAALAAGFEAGHITPGCPAAALAAFLHGMAGTKAVESTGTRSMTAGDLVRSLPDILSMYP